MGKVSYINTKDGICVMIDGKFIPVKKIAEHYRFVIEDDDDIWILIDAISSAAIEGAKFRWRME